VGWNFPCRSDAPAAMKPRRPPPIAPRAGLLQNAGHHPVGWNFPCRSDAPVAMKPRRPPPIAPRAGLLQNVNWGQIPIVCDVQGAFGLLVCFWGLGLSSGLTTSLTHGGAGSPQSRAFLGLSGIEGGNKHVKMVLLWQFRGPCMQL
jgi:hypothetical protein